MLTLWGLFPLLLLALSLGCGLAIERIAGWELPGPLLAPVGLAAVIVTATLTTDLRATAPATTPVIAALALAGYATSWHRLRELRPDPWLVGLGVAVFAVCAAPQVLSGDATFLGYFVDTDPGFHLELMSWVTAHGYSLAGVPLDSSSAVAGLVREYLGTGYPIGADVALGAVRPLIGQDLAWIFAPYLAIVMVFGALSLDALLAGVVSSRALRTLCAFVAAQPGLVYAFYLKLSVKELVVVVLITLFVVLVVELARRPLRWRSLAPLAIVGVAGLDTYSLAVVPWLGIPAAAFTLHSGWRARASLRRPPLRGVLAGAATVTLVFLLALPVLREASTFATVASGVLSQQNELGNLAAALPGQEVFGIWPNGDYRFPTLSYPAAYVLIAVALLGALAALAWGIRRRHPGPLLLLAGDGVAALYLFGRASPYAASKVLMILSVAVVLTAMLGAAALHESGRRPGAWLLAGAMAVGVLWTNLLAYHDASVAPQARLRELAAIGARFRGQGPAFYNLWDTFPVYFLREESVAVPETFAGLAPQRPGLPTHTYGHLSTPWDPDQLRFPYLESFHLLVLGRSPAGSRPPANYVLAQRGHYYDVWRRLDRPRVLAHIPFAYGDPAAPAPPRCATVRRAAAAAARRHDLLAYAPAPPTSVVIPTRATHPQSWSPTRFSPQQPPDFLDLGQSSGALRATVQIPASGRYRVWLQGSVSRPLMITIGGHTVGTVQDEIGTEGQYLAAGTVTLAAGPQSVRIVRPESGWGPGNVVAGDLMGPLVLSPAAAVTPVRIAPPARARSLCGRRLQWIEIIHP